MRMIRRCVILLIALGGLAVMGVGVMALLRAAGETAPSFRTDRITRGVISNVVTATGTLNPVQLVTVGTQVSGQVDKVFVNVNDQVEKGQLLAVIDPSLLETQLKQDQSALETARVNYDQAGRDLQRTRMLLEKDYVAKVDLEHAALAYQQARNAYEATKTVVERDKVNLNYSKIYAPIAGVLISQDVTVGQTVAATYQTPNLFKIAGDLTKMKIDVNLSESDIGKVKVGQPVHFSVDAFPDHAFSGAVQMVNLNPNNQQGVVTYTVVVTVDNPQKLLLPGMTAYVSVTLSEAANVLRVPTAALRFTPPQEQVSGMQLLLGSAGGPAVPPGDGNSKLIYLLRQGKPFPVAVKTGATDDSDVAVSGDGVVEGNTVITGMTAGGKR